MVLLGSEADHKSGEDREHPVDVKTVSCFRTTRGIGASHMRGLDLLKRSLEYPAF